MPTSVLSDGTIRRLIEDGRIRIDPWDPGMLQPASVDLRLGPSFRVFHNFRVAAIDLADPPTQPDRACRADRRASRSSSIPASSAWAHRGMGRAARRHRRPDRGQVVARAPRADRPCDGRLRRPRLPGHADARDHQPDARPDHPLAGQADRPAVVHDARSARAAARTAIPTSAATTTASARRPSRATRAARPRRPAPSDKFAATCSPCLPRAAANPTRRGSTSRASCSWPGPSACSSTGTRRPSGPTGWAASAW